MKGLLRPLVLGLAALALFSACPTTFQNQGIHDYVNRDMEIPLNQLTLYLGHRDIGDYSALDVNPERTDPNPGNTGDFLPDFPDPGSDPNTNNLDVSIQQFIGIEYSEIIRDTVGWELGLFYSRSKDETFQTIYTSLEPDGVTGADPVTRRVETSLSLLELCLGGRYTYPRWRYFQPYAGAGVDFVLANIPRAEATFSPTGLEYDVTEWPTHTKLLYGGYAHIGVNFRIGSVLLGLDGRTLFWVDKDLDYLQAAFTIGYAF